MTVLELVGVTRRYVRRQPPAVDAVSLSVGRGEILALLGPSGSGKSTLLRLIAGFEHPDAGSVAINGRVVADATFSEPPERRGVGIVFQDYALFPHLTVEANVAFGLHGLDRRRRRERMRSFLELVGDARVCPDERGGCLVERGAHWLALLQVARDLRVAAEVVDVLQLLPRRFDGFAQRGKRFERVIEPLPSLLEPVVEQDFGRRAARAVIEF